MRPFLASLQPSWSFCGVQARPSSAWHPHGTLTCGPVGGAMRVPCAAAGSGEPSWRHFSVHLQPFLASLQPSWRFCGVQARPSSAWHPHGTLNDTREIQADFKQNQTRSNGQERKPCKAKWTTKQPNSHFAVHLDHNRFLGDLHLALCLYRALCLYSRWIIIHHPSRGNKTWC